MKTRNVSRRPASPKQKRRSFLSWLMPNVKEQPNSRRLRFESLEERRVLAANLMLSGTQTIVAGANINASNEATVQAEMQTTVNPANPLNVVAFSHRGNAFQSLGLYYSTDGGVNWSTTTVGAANDGFGAGDFRFDPACEFDAAGNLYVAYGIRSGTTRRVVVARSSDGGATINQTTLIDTQADIGTLPGVDRWNLGTGPDGLGGNAIYIAYTQNVAEPGTDQRIVVAGSNNAGTTFSVPLTINDDSIAGTNSGNLTADPSVGPNGELYVSWFDISTRILFDRDLNGLFVGGANFGADITVVSDGDALPVGTADLQFLLSVPAQAARGVSAEPELDVDRSPNGATNGNLYIAFMNQFSGNDTDIMLARSVNQGATWTFSAVEASDRTEFLPWVDVDQTSGAVGVAHYQSTPDSASAPVNVQMAISTDGGLTFPDSQKSILTTATSTAPGGNDFLEYIGLGLHGGTAHALWSDTTTGNQESFVSTSPLINAANQLVITGGAGVDNVILRRSSVNSAYVEVLENGVVTFAGLASVLGSISVNTLGSSDTLTVDFVNGNPVPAGGLSYDGGIEAGTDLLVLRNGAFTNEVSSATGGGSGTIAFSGGALGTANITYAALEPVDDTVAVVNYTFNATAAAEIINIVDGPVLTGPTQTTRIASGSASFELQNIANKTNVTVNALGGLDTVNVNNTAPGVGLTTLTIETNDGGDTVNVLRTPATVTTNVTSDAGDIDTVNVGNAGSINGILGVININNPPNQSHIVVDDSADGVGRTISATNGVITFNGQANVNYVQNDIGDVTIHAGSGGDTFNITSTNDLFGSDNNTFNGNGGADIFNYTGSGSGGGSVNNLNGGTGDDTFNVSIPITFTAVVNVDGGPHDTASPGDALNVNVGGLDVTVNGNNQLTFPGSGNLNYVNIETLILTNLNSLTVNGDQGALINNQLVLTRTLANRFRSLLDAGPAILFDRPLSAGTQFTFNGQTGDDTFTVDNGAAGGLVNLRTAYDGGTNSPVGTEVSGPPGDTLVITGNPGSVVARETYLVGATQDAGTWILDPNNSAGPGVTGSRDGDELVLVFTGLEPVDTDTPAAIFDVILPSGGTNDDLTIDNVGSPLNGFAAVRVLDNAGTFETFRFARKDTTRIMANLNSGGGTDTFRLNFGTAPATATGAAFTLEAYGHIAPGVLGQPADDSGIDQFALIATPVGTTNNLFGNNGNDRFNTFGGVVPFGINSMAGLNGTINIDGGAGAVDEIGLNQVADAGPVAVTLTAAQLVGAGPATINYTAAEVFTYRSTPANDTIDVISTQLGTAYLVNADGGSDTVTVGNSTADFNANTFDGSLAAIAGTLTIAPDSAAAVGVDTLNVDASGQVALAGVASITNVGSQVFTYDGFTNTGNSTLLAGFAPVNIDYRHDATAGGHGTNGGNRLEFLNVRGSTGNDVVNVNDTTAITQTILDTRQGNDLVIITGDNLSGANLFRGLGAPSVADGNDDFILNIGVHIGNTGFAPTTSLQIEGNANSAVDSANRDRVTINDNNGGFVRDLTYDYLDTQGDMDILANTAGNGLFGGEGAGLIPVNIRTMETLRFNGDAANNDLVTVSGTSVDDDITVALTPAAAGLSAQSSAFVFLNGNPYITSPGAIAPPDSLAGNFPGVAGGGTGVDMLINGVAFPAGITLDGSGTSAIGNRAIVQALSETNLLDPVSAGAGLDVFNLGLGAGVLVPGAGVNAAFDFVSMNGAFGFDNDIGFFGSAANQVVAVNIANGQLAPVTVVPASFVNGAAPSSRAGLIANGGDEAAARGAAFLGIGISDNFFATPHPLFTLGVNGNLPVFGPLAADGFPAGDQLNLFSPTSFSIWSDKQTPPNVTIMAGNGPFGVIDSSIERTRLFPGNGVVNLIGDQNNPAVDQTDNFVVRGIDVDSGSSFDGGVQEMDVVINGSAPILIDGVNRLNTYGYDLVGQDLNSPFPNAPDAPATGATADDIDTLEITPFADNAGPNFVGIGNSSPRGWGVGVVFNEGSPAQQDGDQADLLIVHTSIGVNNGLNAFGGGIASEDIVVQPSGPDNGEVRVTSAVDGSVIMVVSYINNTDLIVVDDDGSASDTDSLTLRGTDPEDSANTSGDETVTADFTAAGDVANPLVTVADGASILYRLRNFTGFGGINFELLDGNDGMTLNSGTVQVDVDAGRGNDTLSVTVAGNARVTQASVSTSGTVDQTGVSDLGYVGVEVLGLTSTGGGVLTARGTNDNDTIAAANLGGNRVWINDGSVILFANFATLTLQGLFGDDSVSVTPSGLVGVATINVQGGDPTASDAVIINGTSGADAVTIDTLVADGARVTGLGPTINVSTAEQLHYNGQEGGDRLSLVTPSGIDVVVATPTFASGEGSTSITSGATGDVRIPISWEGVNGLLGSVSFADAGGVRADQLVLQGTSNADVFRSLNATGDLRYGFVDTPGDFLTLLAFNILTPGVATVALNGLDGDDTFNLTATLPFTGILVDGGNPTASDTLNLTGDGINAINVALANSALPATPTASSVTGGGFAGVVTLPGIETVNVNAGAADISVTTTSGPDNLDVTPISATRATMQLAGANQVLNTNNAGALNIDGANGLDAITVHGSLVDDTITVTGVLVAVDPNTLPAFKTVNFVDFNDIRVLAGAGNDTINVTPATGPIGRVIFVDGGDPIGSTAGDSIVLFPPGAFTVEPGPENDEGGLNSAGAQRVSWDHIEAITVTGGPGPGLILGSNGDDDITIIARDNTTHVGANGVQDFTVSVNDGLEVLFLNISTLFVDALAGDDDVVVREPAPNNAVWNVQLFIAGGTPAAPTVDQGDVLELETSGTQTVIYTSTGIDTATLNDTTNTSLITMAPFAIPALGYTSSPGGFEQVIYQGLGGGDTLTINGTAAGDSFVYNPANAGTGTFASTAAPAFSFLGVTLLNINGGGGGADDLVVNGTQDDDTITSPATDAIALTGGGRINIGAGLDQVNLNSLDGNDTITLDLDLDGLKKVVDAGAGNDSVNLLASDDGDIFGGIGDDTLIGTPLADNIFGGAGNDIIIGAGGVDHEYGEDGNDRFGDLLLTGNGVADDGGADFMFGGDGIDQFIWEPGDGSDNISGGDDSSDILRFFGDAGVNAFVLNPNAGAPTHMNTILGGANVDTHGVEQIIVSGLAGADTFTVADLTPTEVADLVLIVDAAAGSADAVIINGRTVADNVNVTVTGARVNIAGLEYDVNIDGVVLADADTLTFHANGGNDNVLTSDALSTLFSSAEVTINGGDGNDFISGFGTINGDAGDDTLLGSLDGQTINGGTGNDTIRGGAGQDIMSGDAGDDTFLLDFDAVVDNYFGGDGYDTLVFAGTPGNDVMTSSQIDATIQLRNTLNGVSETDFLQTAAGVRTLERVRIEAGTGDDAVVVTHADGLNDLLVNSVLFDIDGGPANTRDRLSVQDNSVGDLVLYRQGTTSDSGSISVGPGNAEPLETVFAGFERVDPIAAAGGAVRFFKLDTLEWNDDIANASYLGADETINVDPNIDPGLVSVPGFADLPADNDFYRIVAERTGTLDIQVYFSVLGTVPSGRPALPNAGNLDIELYDVDGTLIVDSVAGGVVPEFGLNDATDNERIRIPAVAGQTYYLRVLPNGTAINTYSITTVNTAAPVPFDIELLDNPVNTTTNSTAGAPGATAAGVSSDTGRSQLDNITFDNDPTILIRVPNVIQVGGLSFIDDIPANGNGVTPGSPPDETILIPFVASTLLNSPLPGFRVAVFVTENNTTDAVLAGYAQPIAGRPGVFTFTFANDALAPDGSYYISSSVEMIDPALAEQNQGFGELAQSLEAVIDTTLPTAFFGTAASATDGLHPSSDSGVANTPATFTDRVTSDTTPTFWGVAEADTVIRIYADQNGNGTVDGGDVQIATTVTLPYDGTNQYPNGAWEATSFVDLNNPAFFAKDGLRTILMTAEDVAGNLVGPPTTLNLQIFIDTQGPQVTDVDINNAGNAYDLFDPKPSTDGPTPLVNSLVISVRDLPVRVTPFLYTALEPIAAVTPGTYQLRGDYNGIIPIQSITYVGNPVINGNFATGTVELTFFKPLPDDRFTLTMLDEVVDPVGNKLDGESNVSEPQENPTFPTGNGITGGNFVARFTVDTRPEVGTWGAGAAWIDTNGNTTFDQDNADFTNRDITYYMGYTSDNLFAGNFVKSPAGAADDFDKLAAYGRVGSSWRWLVDVDNDGVITPGVDIAVVDPAGINGVPVAGNFDGNAANGDEVGVFTGTTWYFDTNHDFKIDLASALPWSVNGYPVVGNYDGVAGDDLATYKDNTFSIDFGRNGTIDRTFRFGFPTPNNRPVSADMDMDGNDDLGLFVPNRAGVSPKEDAEWYLLVSGGAPIVNRIHADPIDGVPVIDYKPVPFGNDVYIQYGDQFGLPILGNFDPPVTPPGGSDSISYPHTNPNNPLDVNNDGQITPIDALLVINELNTNGTHGLDVAGFHSAPFIDTDKDNVISPHDALLVINRLNAPPAGSPGAEGEGEVMAPVAAHDEVFSQLGGTIAPAAASADASILSLLAEDQLHTKRHRQGK